MHIDGATNYLRELGMLEIVAGRERLKFDPATEIWSVFDRDWTPDDGKDTAFNDAISTAEDRGIRVAWNNDDFELWILLHFEDVDPKDKAFQHRTAYYDRLTEIVKARPVSDPEWAKKFAHPRFSYYDSLKTKKGFLRVTFPLLSGLTDSAMERAKQLAAHHAKSVKTAHQQAPCTMVYALVEQIVAAGGKKP